MENMDGGAIDAKGIKFYGMKSKLRKTEILGCKIQTPSNFWGIVCTLQLR